MFVERVIDLQSPSQMRVLRRVARPHTALFVVLCLVAACWVALLAFFFFDSGCDEVEPPPKEPLCVNEDVTPQYSPEPGPFDRQAFVFVATNESPLIGILTVNQGLVASGTKRQRVVLCTPNIGPQFRALMAISNITVIDIECLKWHRNWKPKYEWWNTTVCKIEIWRLGSRFDRIVYLDADLSIQHNIDSLFDVDEPFVSQADVITCRQNKAWINSGVMSTIPNEDWYSGMMETLENHVIVKGDQELISVYITSNNMSYELLPTSEVGFVYQCGCWKNLPKWPYQPEDVKIVHFTHTWMPYTKAAHSDNGKFWGHFQKCGEDQYNRWKLAYDASASSLKSYMMNNTISAELLVYTAINVPYAVDEAVLQQQKNLRGHTHKLDFMDLCNNTHQQSQIMH